MGGRNVPQQISLGDRGPGKMDRENQPLSSELPGIMGSRPSTSMYNGLFQKAPRLWFYRCNNCPTIIPSRKVGSERGAYASNGSGMILCNPCRLLYRKWKGLRIIDGAGSSGSGYLTASVTSRHLSSGSGELSMLTIGSRSKASASNSTPRGISAPSKPRGAGSSAGSPDPEYYHIGAALCRTRKMYQPSTHDIYPDNGESGDEYNLENAEQP